MTTKIFATKSPAVTQRERDHLALARTLAGECAVLLENDGTLPLHDPCAVALYGGGARKTVRGGTGSGDVNTRGDVTVEQGLERSGFRVTTKAWLDRYDAAVARARREYDAWLKARAAELGVHPEIVSYDEPFRGAPPVELDAAELDGSRADVAVYVIARSSGESADRHDRRGDYRLWDEEREQIALLAAAYERLIVVLNVGGVMDLSELREISGVNALLLMGQLGSAGGDVLADVLLGRVTPSGKLTDTWARQYADYPSSATFSGNDGDLDDTRYTEGVYVGYRYFDSFGVEPLYPFGFGRSYTRFAIDVERVEVERGTVTLTVSVTNTGKTAGKEVVQVYASAPEGETPKPYQTLVGFAKTRLLAPGERETLTLAFHARELESYSERRAAWLLDAGAYVLRVGNSSRDNVPAAVLTLAETVETETLRNLFADPEPVAELAAPQRAHSVPDGVPHIALRAADIERRAAHYRDGARGAYATAQTRTLTLDDVRDGRCTVEELIAQLSVEEMAELCVGTEREGDLFRGAPHVVPGAAGVTSAALYETRGVRNLILADGPAGLRLRTVFRTDRDGALLPDGADESGETWYQYCTAVPVAWSLAQSWNMELLERIGTMIGAEMALFGVDLWLAPALNIHRDPLCGRNFEYFSEDPLVSGKAAAAITRGVQREPGRGATIKHFCANDQENNRFFSNSHVSERALREIYLRGFEIAVREAKPLSIMTSYNLLNGTHTANRADLIQSVARDEWGFDGVVMSDWYTSQRMPFMMAQSKYPISSSAGCVCAGNDLQMPGCAQNVDDILRAVRGETVDGYRVTLGDLQYCAANVLRAVLYCDGTQR